MHGHLSEQEFLTGISSFLGGFYLFIAVMNAVAAFFLWRSGTARTLFAFPRRFPLFGGGVVTDAVLWLGVSLVFIILAPLGASGDPFFMNLISVPQFVQEGVNWAMDPTVYSVGSVVIFVVMFWFRRFFVKPPVAWAMLNLSLLLMGMSMTNRSFADIVMKPDNVPIVGLIFLLGYFTWLSAYRAVINDDRIERGEPPLEAVGDEKILVWPDLVYTELICMVGLTALMLVWAISLDAPLEEPASSVKTPNPSKAPWYFLGLQEMLVYYDPWMAGVVLPSMIVFGLMAIPYIDFNKKGNGYYTIKERMFAYVTFQFGFLVLWVTLIVMGTFLRGPNWNFYGPYEAWDAHKVEALNNVDLSEYFWIYTLGMARPTPPAGAGIGTQLSYICLRELPGIILVALYFVVIPPLLAGTVLRKFFLRMGFIRYIVLVNLLLFMALLPIKMALRWTVNLKYFIAIPEYFLNL
jgi:hypothetical protein